MYNRIKDGTKFDFKVGVMREITRIEAKPSMTISVDLLVEILNKIPKGRLTRIKDIEDALKDFYGIDILHFESVTFANFYKHLQLSAKSSDIFDMYYDTPWWRLVSNIGCIPKINEIDFEDMQKALKKEKFTLIDYNHKAESRVKDYKQYLVDYKITKGVNGEPVVKVI